MISRAIGEHVVREEAGEDLLYLGKGSRLDFTEEKPDVGRITRITGQRRTAGAQFQRQQISGRRHGNDKPRAKRLRRECAFGFLLGQKPGGIRIDPVLRQILFASDLTSQAVTDIGRLNQRIHILGAVTRTIDQGEHRTTIQRQFQFDHFGHGQFTQAPQRQDQAIFIQ
jgi:hypothetical protein